MSAYQDYISTYNGSPLTYNGSWLSLHVPKPSALAPYTVRFEFTSSVYDPTIPLYHWDSWGTWTRVSSSPNVWDFTYQNTSWSNVFNTGLYSTLPSCKIIDANLRDVTHFSDTFYGQSNLTSVNLGDLWSLRVFTQPFQGCSSLTDFVIGDVGELSSASYIEFNTGDGHFIPARGSIERVQIGDCYKDIHWISDDGDCPYLKSVTIGTQYATTSIYTMFKGLSGSDKGLVITMGDMPLVESAEQAFFGVGASSSSSSIMQSSVTLTLGSMPSLVNARAMFEYSYIFGQAPNLDLSNVTNARHMFAESHFSSIPRYNMPVCTTAEGMCLDCPELTEVPLLHINSACDISQIFYSKSVSGGLRDTLQHPCELFPYYCHPNQWQQYSTNWMTYWFQLHPEITEHDPIEIERYYYSDNSWNRTAYTSMALASVSSAVNGQEGVPNQWYDN